MSAHTDILDNALFLAVPFLVALAALRPGRGMAAGLMGMALLAVLLYDLTNQLPFPASFPGNAGVPDLRLALTWVGVSSIVSVLLAPHSASGFLACLLAAPGLALVVFTANAVAACNPYVHHDGIARSALAYGSLLAGTMGVLAGVVCAAAGDGRGWPATLGRSVACAALAAGGLGWGMSGRGWAMVGLAGLLPLAALLPWSRARFASWVTFSLRWTGVAWISGVALAGLLLLGVLAHYRKLLPEQVLGDHSGTGWLQLGDEGPGVLPMTGVYLVYPLLLCALATAARPQRVPGVPSWLVPGWAVLGGVAAVGTVVALLIQGETGLSTLVIVATVAWWLAVSGRIRMTVFGLGVLAGLAALGVLAMYRSPVLLARASGILDRLSWSVLGYDDGRAQQAHTAWQFFRDVGWWGTGLRDPGGPLTVPAWSNDFLSMTAARFLGICGAVGLVAASLLPAVAVACGAAAERFETDADHARPAAVFAVPWTVLWGGGAVWVSAGAMGLVPLSGLTMGLAAPALNHILWTLPVVAWVAARSAQRAEPSSAPMAGLRVALNVTWLGMVGVGAAVLALGWRRLADRDDAWVLPFEMAGTVRVTANGDAVRVEDGDDVSTYAAGETFSLDRAQLRVVAGPSVEVTGVHLGADDLSHGVQFGLAGRHALLHPDASLIGDRIALTNDVWLEADADDPTRWRELTIRRAGPQVFAIAPVDDAAIQVIALDGGVCDARSAGEKCPLSDLARVTIRQTYSFVVHRHGAELDLDWLDGQPEARLVPRDRGMLIGDRTLAPREGSDQVWVGEARAELGLLGQAGVLYVRDGILRVRDEDIVVPVDGKESEAAVARAAQVARSTWLTRRSSCKYGWAWANAQDPLYGGGCVDGWYRGRPPGPDYLARIIRKKDRMAAP